MTLVPEVADLCARTSPDTLVLAAGGIADGRGLAAALMLGADGVVIGTCLFAAEEAQVHRGLQHAAVTADGDATVRTAVVDIVRGLDWPPGYSIRVLRNALVERWHGREDAMRAGLEAVRARYAEAAAGGDGAEAGVIVGEAIGLVDRVEPAAAIIGRIAADAAARLRAGAGMA
jgi:nitronate monooxygenase